MGSSTCSDIVPFVIHLIYEDCNYTGEDPETDLEKIICGECYDNDIEVRGWIPGDFTGEYGKRKRLYTSAWSKDDHVIHFVNESVDASGGAMEMAVCADTKAALELFLSDFPEMLVERAKQYTGPEVIEENDTVQQTL